MANRDNSGKAQLNKRMRTISLIVTAVFAFAADRGLGQQASPLPGEKVWDSSIALVTSPALSTNGTLYGVAEDGHLHAWDAVTGQLRWKTNLTGFAFGYYGPLVVGPEGHVYAGTSTGLHAVDGNTGRILWTAGGGPMAVGPDGTIFVVGEEKVQALDSSTGTVRWEWGAQVFGMPALAANGVLFVVGSRGRVIALDTGKGEPIWISQEQPADLASVVITADGKVLASGWAGLLLALDGTTGKKIWEYQAAGEFANVIVTPDGDVWLGLYYGPLPLLDGATGQWKRDLNLPFGSRSGITLTSDGTLYVVGGIDSNLLHAINSTTGETNWAFRLPGYGVGGLNVATDGTVYFHMHSIPTGLFAIRGTTPLADSAWPAGLQNPQNSSFWKVTGAPQFTRQPRSQWAALDATTTLHFYSPVTRPLQIQWRYNGQPIPNATNETLRIEEVRFADAGSYSVALSNVFGQTIGDEATLSVGYGLAVSTLGPGTVQRIPPLDVYPTNSVVQLTAVPQTNRNFLGWSGDASGPLKILTISLTGNRAITATFEYLPGDLKWRPAVADADVALSADGRILYGHERYAYVAIETATGRRVWEQHANGEAYSPPAIGRDGTIYIGSYGSTMNALDARTGAVKWRFSVGTCVHSCPAVGVDGTLYFAGSKLYAVDPTSGLEKWSVEGESFAPAVTASHVVCATVAGRMSAFNGVTGRKLWEFDAVSASSPAIGSNDLVYFGATDGKVYALNSFTGQKQWEFVAQAGIRSSPVIGPDGCVYIGSEDANVYALDGFTGAKRWQFPAGGPVISKGPALAADGTLYVVAAACETQCGRLFAIDSRNGASLWDFDPKDGRFTGDANAALNIGPDGTVYFGSYALHGTSPLASSPWPKFQGHRDNRGRALARPLFDQSQSRFTSAGIELLTYSELGDVLYFEWTGNWNNWNWLETVTNETGSVLVLDSGASGDAARFYRARHLE